MESFELIFVTGSNAAGKSSLIRSHLSEFPDHEVIMTDVYKGRSRQVFSDAVKARKSIILETPFNDEGFKDLIDQAKTAGYHYTFRISTNPISSILAKSDVISLSCGLKKTN